MARKAESQTDFLQLTVDLTTTFTTGVSVDCLSQDQTAALNDFVDGLVI